MPEQITQNGGVFGRIAHIANTAQKSGAIIQDALRFKNSNGVSRCEVVNLFFRVSGVVAIANPRSLGFLWDRVSNGTPWCSEKRRRGR